VTGSVNRNSSKVFEAMGAGALDAVKTPVLQEMGISVQVPALLGKIQTINRLIGSKSSINTPRGSSASAIKSDPADRIPLIVIGASAGGPAALAAILAQLPASLPASILVVQHVDSQFASGLAGWLDRQTGLHVRLAREGEEPQPGAVLLTGVNEHLVLSASGKLGYVAGSVDDIYRPSIDVFFKSVERSWRGDVLGILLTGMGRDGAEGLKALHRAGHHTIAQDKASSAVFGMPKAAAELRAASEILALEKIGPRVKTLLMPATQPKHG
jgi:two-component system response regulator WspF